MAIRFDVDPDEARIILRIAKRYEALCSKYRLQVPKRQQLVMDITACHRNGLPLKLTSLLLASEFEFIHDVAGIISHMNRTTGHLQDLFVPRYAKCVSTVIRDDDDAS